MLVGPAIVSAPRSCSVPLLSLRVPVPSSVSACPPVAFVKVVPFASAKLPATFIVWAPCEKAPEERVNAPATVSGFVMEKTVAAPPSIVRFE